jgi:MFS family permease
MSEHATLRGVLKRKPVVAWALYDWANSAFATTIMAGLFPVFYSAITQDLSTEDSQFWFNVTLAAASVLIAVSAPILGAVADRGGARKKFLVFFASIGILMTAGLAWVHAGYWWMGLVLYGLGTVGFSGANVFYDSMLVDVAEEDELDLVSALGYSAGYIGGGLLFTLNVLMVQKPEWFGLESAGSAVKASFLSVAVWWALFTIPLLRLVDETPTKDQAGPLESVRAGLRQLADTLKEIRSFRVLVLFLVAYWIYIDGVNTVIKTAVFFGDRVLGLEQAALITALRARATDRAQAGDLDRHRGVPCGARVRLALPARRRGLLRARGRHRPRAGRRTEPFAVPLRAPGPTLQDRRVLWLLQHGREVCDDLRPDLDRFHTQADPGCLGSRWHPIGDAVVPRRRLPAQSRARRGGC